MRRRSLALIGAVVLDGGILGVAASAGAAPRRPAWTPNAAGGLDCNGFSPVQQRMAPTYLQCTDIRPQPGEPSFEDNGHYVGHDEPMHQYFSNNPGSGGAMQYRVRLPRDPSAIPTGSFSAPIYDGQLEVAPWFSMVMCDTQSWP